LLTLSWHRGRSHGDFVFPQRGSFFVIRENLVTDVGPDASAREARFFLFREGNQGYMARRDGLASQRHLAGDGHQLGRRLAAAGGESKASNDAETNKPRRKQTIHQNPRLGEPISPATGQPTVPTRAIRSPLAPLTGKHCYQSD